MNLKEIYNNGLKISFEIFPPKEQDKYQNLLKELDNLKKYKPAFVSLTCGAGGSNSGDSKTLLNSITASSLEVMPHFTCVCSSKDFVLEHLKYLEENHIKNILALRGDIPEDKTLCCHDFSYANELVEFIKANSNLSIGVAGYPEGHIEAETLEIDIKNLKKKIYAGADAIFTQLFFDNNKFFKYIDIVRKENISIPIVPGIMPIISKKQIYKMLKLARITIPEKLAEKINKFENSNSDMKKLGIEYTISQCENLIKEGVCGIHFYTLNKSDSIKEILDNIL